MNCENIIKYITYAENLKKPKESKEMSHVERNEEFDEEIAVKFLNFFNDERNDERIEIMVNSCYGGWHPSDKAIKLYHSRVRKTNPDFIEVESFSFCFDRSYRHDPILVQIFKELGDEFDEVFSKTRLVSISKKYEKFYSISEEEEADGIETVGIDILSYLNVSMN